MTQAADWMTANQRFVMAAIAEIRERVQQHSQGKPDASALAAASEQCARAAQALSAPSSIDRLTSTFGLSRFERSLLLLCAGVELDVRLAQACAAAQDGHAQPTFGLALALLPDAHWSALVPAAPLRRHGLIEVSAGDSITAVALRIGERVLHQLAGVVCLDERLAAYVQPLESRFVLSTAQQAIGERIVAQIGAQRTLIVQLCGHDAGARRNLAAAVATSLEIPVFCLDAEDIPSSAVDVLELSRLWNREALLRGGAALFIDMANAEADSVPARATRALLQRLQSLVLVSGREPLPTRQRTAARFDVPALEASERRSLWQHALAPHAARLDGALDACAAQFELGVDAIRAVGLELSAVADSEDLSERLWNACRTHARSRLDDLAERLATKAKFADIVLPETQLNQLRELAARVEHRYRVHEEWGFAGRSNRGLGVSALFAGASGTGKTMAAEALGNELDLDLYRVDLSQVVSKYIGETEKNLRRIFDVAEESGAILLFDEADALFGKRSEVKDSHDRYANVEVSYLLQRMEAYRGLAILTTNLKENIDASFLRRIRVIVDFPFPNAEQRARIWAHVFPPTTPTSALDPQRLARLNVSGGHIYNIALNAAFLAAGRDEAVQMGHLLQAARNECQKLERALTSTEVQGWV